MARHWNIGGLELDSRTYNCLKNEGINTEEQARAFADAPYKVPNFGPTSLRALKAALGIDHITEHERVLLAKREKARLLRLKHAEPGASIYLLGSELRALLEHAPTERCRLALEAALARVP